MNSYYVSMEDALAYLHRKFKTQWTKVVIERLQNMSEDNRDKIVSDTAFKFNCDPDQFLMHLTTYGLTLPEHQ